MADFILQIREEVADGESPGTSKHGLALQKGDIVRVRRSRGPVSKSDDTDATKDRILGGVKSENKSRYIHVAEVPANVAKAFSNLENPLYVPSTDADELAANPGRTHLWRQRKFRFRVSLLSKAVRDELTSSKEATIAWRAARGAIVKKSATDQFDRRTDVESPITNQDVIDG